MHIPEPGLVDLRSVPPQAHLAGAWAQALLHLFPGNDIECGVFVLRCLAHEAQTPMVRVRREAFLRSDAPPGPTDGVSSNASLRNSFNVLSWRIV